MVVAHLTFALGLIGSIVSFMVFLSPLATFYKVYKKKSTEGFGSMAYVVGLFSSVLWMYYMLLKGHAMIQITIRSLGIFIQTFCLCVFVYYAPKRARMECLKLIMFIVIAFGLIVVLTQFLTKGAQRDVIVGWIFLVLSSLCVILASLAVLGQVIKTESIESMPVFPLLLVTLNAVIWFFYGLLHCDFNIMIPNTVGFTLGIIQVIFYLVYKNKKPDINEKINVKITENKEQMSEVDEPRGAEVKDQHAIDMR